MKPFFRGVGASLLLLGLGLGCDSVTPIAPSDAILTITVNPTRIETAGQATITVLARKTDGFPVNEGTEITFSTTLGRIDPEVAFTDEQGRATTVLFGNNEVGLATVTAVSGSIEITAETAVQIGSIPNSLIFEVSPSEVNLRDIDSERTFRLVASVVDDLGNDLKGATVRFESEIGKLASRNNPILTNARGVARDTLTVKKNQLSSAGSSFIVTCTVTGGDTEGFIELTTDEEILILGNPFDLFLETTQSSVPAEGASIGLVATVLDDQGEPLDGARVQFESSAGRVASLGGVVRTDANGQAFDTLEITEVDIEALPGNTITVTARLAPQSGVTAVSDTETLNVQAAPPIAGFTFVQSCTDVTFTNTTTPASTSADPVEYTWDFGDGSPLLLTNIQSPVTHAYPGAGNFMATLTATNIFGTDTVTNPVVIDLTITPAFTAVPLAGMVVNFDASSSVVPDPSATYTWDFGDGTSGTGVTTSHTYAASGGVTVTLTISACGGTAMVSRPVTVSP